MARSAVHHRYAELGATFDRQVGWELPVRFPYDDKARAESADVVLADESAVGKFHLESADLQALTFPFPTVTYAIKPGVSLLIVPAAHRAAAAAQLAALGRPERSEGLAQPASGCAHVVDVSSGYASFLLAGPDAPEVLARFTTNDLGALTVGQSAACGLAGHPAVVGRHTKGWRILVGRDEAEDLWELIENSEPDLQVASWDTAKDWLWT